MIRLRCAKWPLTVLVALMMTAISEPAALSQLLAQKDPGVSERPTTGSESTPATKGVQNEKVIVHPTEGYFAVFGGYTFGGKFDAAGTGAFNGVSFGNGSLADSAVVGAKVERPPNRS